MARAFQNVVGVGLPMTTHLTTTLCPSDTVLSRGVMRKLGWAIQTDRHTHTHTETERHTHRQTNTRTDSDVSGQQTTVYQPTKSHVSKILSLINQGRI